MHARKTLSAAAVGAALAVFGSAAQAQAQGLEVKISGQVNRAMMGVDDGIDSEAFHVDNDNSSTRFRFVGSADVAPGIRAGILWEVEYQSNPSNLVTMATRDSPTSTSFDERYIDLFFDSPWGKLSLGQGDGAANGGIEVDLSGTAVAHYADVSAIGGAIAFRTAAGGVGPTIAQTTSQQDFESRYDRVRYDTPVFGGFVISGSHGVKDSNRDVSEVALRYGGDFGRAGKLAGAIGQSDQEAPLGGIDDKVIGGSVSWLHGSGFNVTVGSSEREIAPNRDGTFNYVKLGYKTGKHAFSADFALAEDQAAAGDESEVVGFGYAYAPTGWADVYALVKRHSLDRVGASFEDITVAMAGTRLKF
jgi:predicted porin